MNANITDMASLTRGAETLSDRIAALNIPTAPEPNPEFDRRKLQHLLPRDLCERIAGFQNGVLRGHGDPDAAASNCLNAASTIRAALLRCWAGYRHTRDDAERKQYLRLRDELERFERYERSRYEQFRQLAEFRRNRKREAA